MRRSIAEPNRSLHRRLIAAYATESDTAMTRINTPFQLLGEKYLVVVLRDLVKQEAEIMDISSPMLLNPNAQIPIVIPNTKDYSLNAFYAMTTLSK